MVGGNQDLLAALLLNKQRDAALAAVLEHLVQAHSADLVACVDLVVVGLVLEGQGYDALLLEVGFVDTGEGFGEDDSGTEVTGL